MSDLSEIKSLIQTQGEAFEAFKKANEEKLAAKADGKGFADAEVKLRNANDALDKVQKDLDALAAKVQRPDQSEGKADQAAEIKSFGAQPNRQGPALTEESYAAYKEAVAVYIRKNGNLDAMSEVHRKAMIAGIDSEGGYLTTPAAVNSIVTKMRENVAIRQIAGQITISGNAIEGLTDRADAGGGWVAELGSRTATSTPTLGKDRIEVFEMYAFPQLSQTLLDDTALDLEGWISGKVAQQFADLEAPAFATGNGVGKPRGIFDYTTVTTADSTRTWGQMQHIATGVNGDFAASVPGDKVIELSMLPKTPYLANAKWLMNRAVLLKIRQFKAATTNEYLWQPGLAVGAPSTILGYPVVLDENVPALSGNGLSMAFGDFSRGYMVVDRSGVSMLRDPYTNKPYVGLYFRRRVGGAVRDFDALKFMKFATS